MKEEMKQAILELFQKNSDYSFPELIDELETLGLQAKGTRALYARENSIMWEDTSADFNLSIVELVNENKIILQPLKQKEALIVYSYAGDFLELPVGSPNETYSTPHWIPTIVKLN